MIPQESPPTPSISTRHNRILRLLGRGGFGTTYLCHDEHLQKNFVIKEFTPHALITRGSNGKIVALRQEWEDMFAVARTNFLGEARELAKFNHSNIVRVNRYFEAHNTAYFVMDHEDGRTLQCLLRTGSHTLTEKEIVAVVMPLCRGLSELHHAGLIHRDIKPANIILRSDGTSVLIDLGAAVDFRSSSSAHFETVGTPAYAPIEQIQARDAQGPWTDIYALGAIMYEMIVGEPPASSLTRAAGSEIEPASSVGRGRYSDRLLGLIDKSLSMNRVERPQSISEFIVVLEANDEERLRVIIHDISFKMINHFSNMAKPNEGLCGDELIAFVICFPIIDLSWRLGKGIPDRAVFAQLYKLMGHNILGLCCEKINQRGFKANRHNLTPEMVYSRLDGYAAAYLLDRQQSQWRYSMTCQQIARNCISTSHAGDIPAFVALLEEVIDRARGRVKKEFNKQFRNVKWYKTTEGWRKVVVRFPETN